MCNGCVAKGSAKVLDAVGKILDDWLSRLDPMHVLPRWKKDWIK
jgi:hypothetical protein